MYCFGSSSFELLFDTDQCTKPPPTPEYYCDVTTEKTSGGIRIGVEAHDSDGVQMKLNDNAASQGRNEKI